MKCMNSVGSAKQRRVCVPGAVVVGAGPSGLAAAACLKRLGVPSVVLERSKCLASLWHLKTYDRLRLHLPKQFCELPHMPFPSHYPTYPTKQQFIDYLESYARRFGISPTFDETVTSAQFDPTIDLWRVHTTGAAAENSRVTEYVTRWLVVATGENSEPSVPELDGRDLFAGTVQHTSSYKSGEEYEGKNVLVVGCGNSGMEVCLDLCNYNAHPSIVIRDSVHILPREIIGISTFGLSMWLLKWIPLTIVDHILVALTSLLIGNIRRYGLRRPKMGPLLQKNLTGKTPVLDVGAMDLIRTGRIKVRPAIRRLRARSVEFVDGRVENFDAIVLATGYKSNVPSWLKEGKMFCEDGYPRRAFPEGWKGDNGLYAIGFTRRGLLGAGMDAIRVAEDIQRCWKAKAKHLTALASFGLPLSS